MVLAGGPQGSSATGGRRGLLHSTTPRTATQETIPERYLREVDLSAHERLERARTLTTIVWIALTGSLVLFLVYVVTGDRDAMISVAALAASCLPILWLNRHGHQTLAGLLLFGLLLAVAGFNMIVDSEGLHDPVLIAYPIFVIVGALLLGKRALPALTLAAIATLALVAWLEARGLVHPEHPAAVEDLLTIAVLMVAGALVVWVSMSNLGKSLDRVRHSEAKVLQAYEQTLEAWARALEYRDRETEGHSRRVTELSTLLARVFGCSEAEVNRIRWGALLHDIGKLAIPDRVLLKPGPLTEEEMELMRQHPVYAREMLSTIPFLRRVMSIPCYHHERWDGRGYPEGLQGEDIPLAARIFTVVDQWEALRSDRPYRKAWPRDRVLAYMQENAGKIFDPHILEVFLERIAPVIDGEPAPENEQGPDSEPGSATVRETTPAAEEA